MTKKKEREENVVKKDSFTQQLFCILTEPEIKAHGQIIAEKLEEVALADNALTDMKKQFQSKISQLEATIALSASLVRSGKELRPVKCHVVINFKENSKRLFREDTGEMMEESALEESERQREMELKDNAPE